MKFHFTLDTSRLESLVKYCVSSRRARVFTALFVVLVPLIVVAATVTKPKTFTDGTVVSAADINANFDAIFNAFNAAPFNTAWFPGSNIVSVEQGQMLNSWVGTEGKLWKLCYSTRANGYSSSTFHSLCNNKGESITVAKLSTGKIIGGYAGCSWASIQQYNYGCGGSFIFSLSNKHKYEKHFYHNVLTSSFSYLYYTYDNSTYGPTWGGGHDLHFDLNGNSGYCNLGHDYTCRMGLNESNGGYGTNTCRVDLCGAYSGWNITDLEVWINAG